VRALQRRVIDTLVLDSGRPAPLSPLPSTSQVLLSFSSLFSTLQLSLCLLSNSALKGRTQPSPVLYGPGLDRYHARFTQAKRQTTFFNTSALSKTGRTTPRSPRNLASPRAHAAQFQSITSQVGHKFNCRRSRPRSEDQLCGH